MLYRVLPFIAVICEILGHSARADGLVFQVPPDGSWALYMVTAEAEFASDSSEKRKVSIDGTLTISSVGEVTRNEQKCRWLELKFASKTEGVYPKVILKVLVPEEQLQRGRDPLSHAVLTFFNRKPVDEKKIETFIDQGFNRIQYEIDRFRDVFPKPLENAKNLNRETIETPAGKFENCEVITGTGECDCPLLGDGRSVFKSSYRIAVHPNSPFGVVSMQIGSEGREISGKSSVSVKGKKTLTLTEMGTHAASELPDDMTHSTTK